MMGRLRLAWVSPFGPRSDIGAFSRCILQRIAREGETDCHLYVNSNGPTYSAPLPTFQLVPGTNLAEIVSTYDAALFNLGNNVANHGEVTELLRSMAGIAILHDFSYHHYFAHSCFEEVKSRSAYARLLHEYHGSEAFQMAVKSGVVTRGPTIYAPWDAENGGEYPLVEPLASLASALVVHSRFMEEKVRRFFSGPILRLFLPSDQKLAPSSESMEEWRSATRNRNLCHFATFGHISRSKCLDVILHAMARSPVLRSGARLTIAGYPGDLNYCRELEALVESLRLSRQVTLEYGVSNERLLQIKNGADVFMNLRFPNTEGASGSLVEMLNAGRPVIVYRSGCYADLPGSAAVLIEREEGVEGVTAAMEMLAADPSLRITVGTAGLEHVRQQDSCEYVKRLTQFVAEQQNTLRRRGKLVAPVRDAYGWTRRDVDAADSEWFSALCRARRNLLVMREDPYAQSPEIFLTWSPEDLISLTCDVLLDAFNRAGLFGLLSEKLTRLGRWDFYDLVSKLRYFQAVCEAPERRTEELLGIAQRIDNPDFWSLATRLQPEIYVRMLHLCILERGWTAEETKPNSDSLWQGESAVSMLQEFLEGPEYQLRFGDDRLTPLACWARDQVVNLSTPESFATFYWPPHTTLRFNQVEPQLEDMFDGEWHPPEKQGRWSSGAAASISFLAPDAVATAGANLRLRVRVAGTSDTGPRNVLAHCNRLKIGQLTFVDDKPQDWTLQIPPSAYSDEGLRLLLISNETYVPVKYTKGADKRRLGIMLLEGHLAIPDRPADEPVREIGTGKADPERTPDKTGPENLGPTPERASSLNGTSPNELVEARDRVQRQIEVLQAGPATSAAPRGDRSALLSELRDLRSEIDTQLHASESPQS